MAEKGIHHITAIAGDPQRNYEFYTQVMGLRLVKKTVNFDDPSSYHLYYGNESGDPGSIITFFTWPHMQKGKPDRGQVVSVAFAVPTTSKQFWIEHLEDQDVSFEDPFERFGKEVIGFQDPDGLYVELVFSPGVDGTEGWGEGVVPQKHAIRGIHGVSLAEKNYEGTGRLLEYELGFELTDQLDNRYYYTSGSEIGSVIEVIDQFQPNGRAGRGTVHHIAFRSEDEQEQQAICEQLYHKGYHLTEVKDRTYFKSVYFHEPGGILFEVATDPPGFTVDENLEDLGSSLTLPDNLEPYRHKLEADLPELNN
ncbi:glyoxalase family protein [Fodinibius salinus]|uniref:Glyoxalase family protein n=1 Tax=Fodinibius salinus TaxID=860790 RepID=A0A5D3YHN5_9BACT|nr:ring-cleaving dioxygenase [Fodinibius salinus]TYP93414.1 glyoxalase family protein [Fodinibius salinus]